MSGLFERNLFKKLFDEKLTFKTKNIDQVPIKYPDSPLNFTTPSYPYTVSESWLSFVDNDLYSSIGTNLIKWVNPDTGEFTVCGVDFTNFPAGAYLRYAHIAPDGVCYILSDTVTKTTWVYTALNVDVVVPTLQKTIAIGSGYALTMSCSSHYDSTHNVLLMGLYGQDKPSVTLPLYLSSDGGKTWSIIKQTTVVHSDFNSHWHTACFDPYSGRIWASEGDNNNRALNWSDNFGKTWNRIIDIYQPTLIVPFARNVIFGRDENINSPGLDKYFKPPTIDNQSVELTDALSFRPDQGGHWNYPSGTTYTHNQTCYVLFTPKEPPLDDMQYIYATGDGGESWHCVWSAPTSSCKLEFLVGVSKTGHLIARISGHATTPNYKPIFAKAINWI